MHHLLADTTVNSGGISPVVLIIELAIVVVVIAGVWQCFVKAGQPGWAAIIPFYNLYIMLKIAGRPGWWLILFLIPLVNVVFGIITYVDFAKAYGKGGGFAVGLILLGFIFFPILGFGDSRHVGPGGGGTGYAPPY